MAAFLALSTDRLWQSLMEMAEIGGTAGGGCNRQTLTDLDAAARLLLQSWGEAIGLTPAVDRVGNMRLHRPGRDPSRPAVAIGSHLDTQPTGGKFDGPLGVLAGLEIMRALHEADAETEAPLVLINWTNEEGARFSPAMMGSGVAMGLYSEADILASTDAAGAAFGAELARIGWAGTAEPTDMQQLGAYFELHIEQGPTLERDGMEIGVVTHALAQAWFDVTVTGTDAHAGSAMSGRLDALAAAAALIGGIEEIALAHKGRGTVGRLTISPDSRNVVPGRVWFSVDLRADDAPAIEAMVADLRTRAAGVAADRGVAVAVEPFWDTPLVALDRKLAGSLMAAAAARRLRHREMATGIGHDAVFLARRVPSALLFVPCVGGISHNEAEAISHAWAEAGLHVLADAVLAAARLVARA